MITSRRIFVTRSLAAAGAIAALAATGPTSAQSQTGVSENDPQAQALGYKPDGTKTDLKKYPNYVRGQSCSACALFQSTAPEGFGSCAVFGNRIVAGKGWCSAWTKKA